VDDDLADAELVRGTTDNIFIFGFNPFTLSDIMTCDTDALGTKSPHGRRCFDLSLAKSASSTFTEDDELADAELVRATSEAHCPSGGPRFAQ
jgi:hypothetical protein